jgi:hypothetical protein
MVNQTKFEERLNQIIGAEGEISDALDELDDEDGNNYPTVVEYDEVESKVVAREGATEDLIDDYKYGRKILYGLINRGTVALEGAMMVARESEHPRAYEVSANIMKNISEMTRDLMELQKSLQNNEKKQTIAKQINIQNNYGSSDNNVKDINDLLEELD